MKFLNLNKIIMFAVISVLVITENTTVNAGKYAPKNVILFISDGMSHNHIIVTNYYTSGEEKSRIYEEFPVQLSMSTYNGVAEQDNTFTLNYSTELFWSDFDYANNGYTDSGAATTAMATGRKSYRGAVGVGLDSEYLYNLTELFTDLNKSAGVISSVPFSHATPAGFVAHSDSRNNYKEIASQMINSELDVIMGASHPYYDNNGLPADKADYKYFGNEENWKNVTDNTNDRIFIEDKETFEKYALGDAPKRIFGIAQVHSTLQNGRAGEDVDIPFQSDYNDNVPSLETMTMAGINALSQNEKGFFLMVEGGAVDWASHSNQTGRMIEEMTDFNNSVDAAVSWVETHSNWEETLIIITSDHDCGYLTGPNDRDNSMMTNPVINKGKGILPDVKWNSTSHTNSLVPFYAKGANADIFLKYAYQKDIYLGYFIDNTHLPLAIFELYGINPVNKDKVRN